MNRIIEVLNFEAHNTYRLFLLECPHEPLPGTPEWKSSLSYLNWNECKRNKFKELMGLPLDTPAPFYEKEWERYVSRELTALIKSYEYVMR